MAEEWALHSTTVWLWDFPWVVGLLWAWWASELWMEAPSLACLDHPGIVHEPGVRSAQLAQGQQVDFPCQLCPHLSCDPGWVSHPLTTALHCLRIRRELPFWDSQGTFSEAFLPL